MITSGSCSNSEKADLVIINGKVLTIDKENPLSEAIAIKGETIIAVGALAWLSVVGACSYDFYHRMMDRVYDTIPTETRVSEKGLSERVMGEI